jgi:hypothetical protein
MGKNKNSSSADGCIKFFTRGLGFLLLFAFLAGGIYVLLRGAGAYLIIADELQPVNARVMLSGGSPFVI